MELHGFGKAESQVQFLVRAPNSYPIQVDILIDICYNITHYTNTFGILARPIT